MCVLNASAHVIAHNLAIGVGVWDALVKMKKPKRLTKTVPPKKGPVPQGLQIPPKNIQIVKTNKKGT